MRGLTPKILSWWMGSLALTLLIMGGVFVMLMQQQFERTAHERLNASLEQVERRLEEHRSRAVQVARGLVAREDIQARLHLLSRYQDPVADRQALFNPEKDRLARALQEVTDLNDDQSLALFDASGTLVAFHRHAADGSAMVGFTVFEQGRRRFRLSSRAGTQMTDRLPDAVLFDAVRQYPSASLEEIDGMGIAAQASMPVYRMTPSGDREFVGSLVVRVVLAEVLQGSAREMEKAFALRLPSGGLQGDRRLEGVVLPGRAGQVRRNAEHAVMTKSLDLRQGKAILIAALPLDDFSASLTNFRDAVITTILLIAAVLLPLIVFLVRRTLAAPIAGLTRGASALRAGHYERLTDHRGRRDELGELAAAFDAMAGAIQERERALLTAQDTLEQQVMDRTRALSAEIEERRWAENALRASEERLRLVLDSAADAILSLEEDGLITGANAAATRMFGYEADGVIGRSLRVLLPELAEDLQEVVESPESRRETLARRSDGHEFPAEVAVGAVDTGRSRIITVIIVDITAREAAQAEARKLYKAVEHSPAIVFITDPAGCIDYVNPRFSEITGYPRADVLGRTLRHADPPLVPPEVLDQVLPELAAGRVWQSEFRSRHSDGREYWVAAAVAPIFDERGTTTHHVWVQEDVTARKRIESELVEARDAAQLANRAKSEFLSRMSHELRTPMNAILGFAQLLDTYRVESLSDKQRDYVRQILKAGTHLLDLINEVLDLARIEAGRVDLSLESVDPRELLDECVTLGRAISAERGIVIIDRSGPLLPRLRADRTRLKQVLLNLLSNAIKYNRPQGEVVIETAAADRGRLSIRISDQGPGIPDSKRAQIFQPFNRLGFEASDVEGTGIGLTISRKLVDLMDGRIDFVSGRQGGTTFYIDIPIAEGDSVAPDAEAGSPASAIAADDRATSAGWLEADAVGRKTRLMLYVEDNPANLRLMEEVVAQIEDVRLLTAHTAEIGLALAASQRPDIIVLDINLPGMDGVEAMRLLRADPRTHHIPVLALSANAMPKGISRAMEAGFRRYLTKPVDVGHLVAALRECLEPEPTA